MIEAKRKKLTVHIDEELHHAARVKIADVGTKFAPLLVRLLREWTFGELPKAKSSSVSDYAYPRTREDHETLELILLEGDRQAAESIRQTLKLVAEAVRARSAVRPKRKTG